MAKYRITSIPQARYGGVFNKTTKIMKGRKDNESSTDQEQPMVEVENVAQPSYWNEMQSPVMTGKQCPPGKYDYNGQCLTESELRAAWAEEQKGFEKQMSDRKLAHEQKIQESRQRLYDELVKNETTFRENKWNEYQNTYKNSKKSDKIEPFDRIPLTEFSKEREDQFKQARFLVNKNKETGFAELYPIELAYDRIINNGYQADQFKNYWGLDPKQVKEQLGPLMDAAKQQYDATLTNEIVEKAIKEGKSIEKVIESLPASRGTKEGLKEFEKPATELIDKALDYMVDTYAESNQTDPSKISKDQNIFFSNDPITAWEKKYHDHDLKYYSDKSNRGGKAFNEQLNKSKVNPDIQYNNYDDQMAQQRDANRRSLQAFTLPKAIQAGQNAENEDFMKAFGEFQNNITAPVVNEIFKKAVNALPNDQKPQFINDIQVAPNLTMQRLLNMPANKSGETYSDLLQKKSEPYMNAASIHSKYNITQGKSNRELTTEDKVKDVLRHPIDAAYYWLNPREEMWGNWNMGYDDRLKAEDKFDVDLGTMSKWTPTGVLTNFTPLQAMNPFKIGMNLREAYDEGNFLSGLGDELWDVGSHIGFMNGLNAIGKGAGFFKPMIRNIFNNPISQLSYYASAPSAAKNAYENYQKGDYTAAALNGLGAMAPVFAGRNAIKTLNSLKTPGTIMTNLLPESRYTFTYNAATPGSGIFIGNPNTAIPGIGQPKFQSITKPINTLSKNLGFGEFNINKVNPGWRVPEQPMSTNLLGYSKGGTLPKANLGQIVKTGKNLGRIANIGTIGTVNSLAKTLAPVMMNPIKILTFGAGYDGLGPFTGSPLNYLPFYGKDLSEYVDNTAFRKFGDSLDYVKLTGQLDPSHGPLLRMGKSQIKKEGNWAEPGNPNESYPGVFGVRLDTKAPGTNLGYRSLSRRNGVLITDNQGAIKPSIPISDPGLSFHRRLPFSNRYIPVNMEALRNDQFDPATMGGNLQSLLERYGYGAAYAAALAGMGMTAPQEYLDEYVEEPVKKVYGKAEELLTNPWQKNSTQIKEKGGILQKASLGQVVKAGTKLTKAAKPAIYLMESPGLRVTVPEFESLVNENLAKGLGIKKIDDQLKVKINPVTESSFYLSGNPLLRLDMSTYVGNNLTGDIGITRFDKGQHGIPTLEDQLIFMKERDYPFGLSDRFNLMGTGVSGEFNKAITNSLQQVGLNPLVSSGMHTQEGRKRWDDLTEKGHATQLHKHFYMLHKNGGVALELTQKEIDQYVKDGYIVEDE